MSNFNSLSEIEKIIKDISAKINKLNQYADGAPSLEVDIIKERIRFLYERVEDIGTKAQRHKGTKEEVVEEKKAENVQEEDIPEVEVEKVEAVLQEEVPEVEEEDIKEEEVVAENIVEEIKEEELPEKEESTEIIEEDIEEEPALDLFSSQAETVADQYSDKGDSVHDKIADTTEDVSIASKMQLNPISDIKTEIGINEKFMFINSLFEGSMQEYSEAIELLNGFNHIEEANKLFQKMKDEYSWDVESEAAKKLYELIERKYGE